MMLRGEGQWIWFAFTPIKFSNAIRIETVHFAFETYGFYESHFMNESCVEDIIESIVEVSYNLKCQYGFWQSVKLRYSFLNK